MLRRKPSTLKSARKRRNAKGNTETGTERGVGIGNTSIGVDTIDRARHAEAKIVGIAVNTTVNTTATRDGQGRGHDHHIESTVAGENAHVRRPGERIEGRIVETFAIATTTEDVIALLRENKWMMLKPVKVQPIVLLVCKQRQHHWRSSELNESDNRRLRMQKRRRSTNKTWMAGDASYLVFADRRPIWIWGMPLLVGVQT